MEYAVLSLALLLGLVAVACIVTLPGRTEPDVIRASHGDADPALPEAWRAAAMGANKDAAALRLAIATALDERDARRRDQVLRVALAETHGRVPVRVTL
jgi:hypothetical protein